MITVRLFALLREAAGTDTVELPPGGAGEVRGVMDEIGRRYPAAAEVFRTRRVLAAVNRRYASPGDRVSDGDEVAFLPPVSGG